MIIIILWQKQILNLIIKTKKRNIILLVKLNNEEKLEKKIKIEKFYLVHKKKNISLEWIKTNIKSEKDKNNSDDNLIFINLAYKSYGNIEIKFNKTIRNIITINIILLSTRIINYANLIIYTVYFDDGTEKYCSSKQNLTFIDIQTQMKCTSNTKIACTTWKLTSNPTIISLDDSKDTFGDTSIINTKVNPQSSTLGNINIKLNEVIWTDVYKDILSSQNGQNTEHVDINNIYIDDQFLTFSDDIKLSTTPTKMKCTIEESISYDMTISLRGAPIIKIN